MRARKKKGQILKKAFYILLTSWVNNFFVDNVKCQSVGKVFISKDFFSVNFALGNF